jgi:hypothetical protein
VKADRTGLFLRLQTSNRSSDNLQEVYHRFLANSVGMTWSTDLHFVDPLARSTDPRHYLIAFIDRSSRYVVHSEMLPDNSVGNCPRLAITPPHLRATTDNSAKEFLGVLKKHRRGHHQTEAYSPWANGKIPHWWPTFGKARVPRNSVREILDEYKNFSPHASFRTLVRFPPPRGTPVSDGHGMMARGMATPKCSSYLLFNMRGAG